MAKNYVNSGDTIVMAAPTGGFVAGLPYVVNDLAVVPLSSGPKGTMITCSAAGVWKLPVADGIAAGVKVSALDGALVAAGTDKSQPFGKLATDPVGGYAEVLIVQ